MCATDLGKELTAQQHVFPDYAQMKARIVTVINSRTRGLAPMMMGNLSDEDSNHHASGDESVESEDGELYSWKSGTARKSSLNPVTNQAEAEEEGSVKLTENVRCGRIGHMRADCRAITHLNEGPKKPAPKGKSVGKCEDEETETSQNVPLGTIDLGSFEVLSDHGDEVESDEPTCETTERMPPLPPDSCFKRTETLCGQFRKPCNEDHRDEEDPLIDRWEGKHEHFDAVQQMDPVARNAPKSVPDVIGCLSVYQRLPIGAPQYDISSEGEDDNSNDGEWWPDEVDLNAVTIGNMSTDSKPVATDGAGESVVNPDDSSNVDLKPSNAQ